MSKIKDSLFITQDRELKKIGTIGQIVLLEHNDDSSMTVLVQGLIRVELLTQEQHLPFPIYQTIEYVDDFKDQYSVLNDSIERLHAILNNWLHRHISSPKERERFSKEMNSPGKIINNLCLFVIKDIELKEILLESKSLPERIRMMDALLRGKAPETEDILMSEAIKNFERFEAPSDLKNAV